VAYPFGLCNAMETIASFMVQRLHPLPMGGKFVRMADYIVDSIHDLLESGSGMLFNSNSSEGSHHPSWECFMVENSNGHVSSASDSSKTPESSPCMRLQEG
jgi:hypothetical protein